MRFLHSIFTRVFVVEFYRVNAGFFFLAIGLCFGIIGGREHVALAQSFVSSPTLLLIPIIVWSLYTLKVLQFNKLEFLKNENSFLYNCALLTNSQLWICCFGVSIKQFILPIFYATFLIVVALRQQGFDSLIEIITALAILIAVVAQRLKSELLHPGTNKKISRLKNQFDSWFVRHPIWFYPEWIVRQQPVLVIGTKVFSGLLIIGVSRLYLFDSYDERLMAMGCTLAFSSNLVLVYFYHRFENFHFNLIRGLPISLPGRLFFFIAMMTLLNVTEIGILLNHFPAGLPFYTSIIIFIFGLSIYLVALASLYIESLQMENYIRNVFVASFCWIIAILFKIPVAIIAIVQMVIAIVIYSKTYYQFEDLTEVNPADKKSK